MLPILIVNPNTTTAMTDGLRPLLSSFIASSTVRPIPHCINAFADPFPPSFHHETTKQLPPPTFFTAPEGVPSINNGEDCHHSAEVVLPYLTGAKSASSSASSSSPPSSTATSSSLLDTHSAVLIACYSVHPLVSLLKSPSLSSSSKPVLGIFEASLLASLALLAGSPATDQFGIVTTGAVWEKLLSDGVRDFLGGGAEGEKSSRFAGVATTGLNAIELHEAPPAEVKQRLKDASKRLLRSSREKGGRLRAVCLGCAGMAGMDETVREACVEELGEEEGAKVSIVDGVKAGYAILEGMVRSG
jgi:Asp/Glu/hydantoin racemase